MATLIGSIATKMLAGVTIGLTTGAMFCSVLPLWVGVPTLIAVGIVAICA